MSSISGELKTVVETRVDGLFDRVRSNDMTVSDAIVAFHDLVTEIPNAIYCLRKKHLQRAFVAIGRENDGPSNAGAVKAARTLLHNLVHQNQSGTEELPNENDENEGTENP